MKPNTATKYPQIGVRMTEALKQELENLAKQEDNSVARIVRAAIRAYLLAKKAAAQ
jgi:predicted DNA-binding protein